jgi:hypothetical protein
MDMQNRTDKKIGDYADHYQNQKRLMVESYQKAISQGGAEKAYSLAMHAVNESIKYAEALRIHFKL